MATLTMAQTISDAMAAGFSRAQATTMAAIAAAESSLNPGAVGDVALENSVWGPSVGITQIRTLRSQTGTGGDRDITRLLGDPQADLAASYVISDQGKDFSPWSTYKSGAYKRYLPGAQAASGTASPAQASGVVTGGTAQNASLNPFSAGDWKNLIIKVLFMGGGLGLVVAGALVMVGRKPAAIALQAATKGVA